MWSLFRRAAAPAAPIRVPAPVPTTSGKPDRPKPVGRAAAAVNRNKGKLAAGGALALMVTGFVTAKEGMRTVAYIPVPGDFPTVCVGETKGIRLGMTFTKPQCEAMLLKRLTEDFAPPLEACVTREMSDEVYTAFISLAYNVGPGTVCKSTVVRRFNAGDDKGACDALLAFNKYHGAVLKGLDVRRQSERALCLKGI